MLDFRVIRCGAVNNQRIKSALAIPAVDCKACSAIKLAAINTGVTDKLMRSTKERELNNIYTQPQRKPMALVMPMIISEVGWWACG